jgi:hypothetical protein
LVELHVGKIGGSQQHVGVFDDQLAVEPTTTNATRLAAINARSRLLIRLLLLYQHNLPYNATELLHPPRNRP